MWESIESAKAFNYVDVDVLDCLQIFSRSTGRLAAGRILRASRGKWRTAVVAEVIIPLPESVESWDELQYSGQHEPALSRRRCSRLGLMPGRCFGLKKRREIRRKDENTDKEKRGFMNT